MSDSAVLYFMCGKMGAGKSTLAKSLASDNDAALLSEDSFLRDLYPNEIVDLNSYVSFSGRLKQALGAHICSLLRLGVSVVLDFPANTVGQRAWFRELIRSSGAAHELHFVDVPDDMCKRQLRARNLTGAGDPLQDEATFDLLSTYFVPPALEESFTVVHHTPA
jgi:predicted kinase